MAYGIIPVMMDNLFFRPLMDQEIGIKMNPGLNGLSYMFTKIFQMKPATVLSQQLRAAHYVERHHSYDLMFNGLQFNQGGFFA